MSNAETRIEAWRNDLRTQPELRARVDRWLLNNPPPAGWQQGPDEWAYLEMPLLWQPPARSERRGVMKVTAVPTDQLTMYNGSQCRVWHAVTDTGVAFHMFVRGLAVPADADQSAFERELRSMPSPTEATLIDVFSRVIDTRLIV